MYIVKLQYLLENKWSTIQGGIVEKPEWNKLYAELVIVKDINSYNHTNMIHTRIELIEFEPIDMDMVAQTSLRQLNIKMAIPLRYEIDIKEDKLKKTKYGYKLYSKDISKIRELLTGKPVKQFTNTLVNKKLHDYHKGLIKHSTFKRYDVDIDRITDMKKFMSELHHYTNKFLEMG